MTAHLDASDPLLRQILGRGQSLFAQDMLHHDGELAQRIAGRRILVVGAAGSIGGAFVKQLVRYRPQRLHLVDLNENTMVEVVRDLRSTGMTLPDDFRSVTVDFGSLEFIRFVESDGDYDVFVNFSAMKHVRSERDAFSLARMIDVNVRALHDYLCHPAAQGLDRAFSVSTDKSVRPANLMGATKNLMEQALFAHAGDLCANSARFANVAFSAGSLLEGFEARLTKKQPLAAPSDIRRYFISHEEAGQLCLLSCFLGQSGEVFFPKMNEADDLMSFTDIAVAFLRQHGLEPLSCADDDEARRQIGAHPGRWPCVFTPSDTTGEKPFEEFHRTSDQIDSDRFSQLAVAREAMPDPMVLTRFLAEIDLIRRGPSWNKADFVAAMRKAVPELQHTELGRSLDQKM